MKSTMITGGVWPTMITPFNKANDIDYGSLENLIDWYIKKGVHGLFAVCQSSEMFFLSLDERVNLARFVKEKVAGRVPVIVSGHIADTITEQIEEIIQISATGIDAFVLVSNRLAGPNENDDVWKRNAEILLNEVPDVQFGIYECPYPYKRLLSPELLKWCASTGRFSFLKDTSCDLEQLQNKIDAVKNTNLKVFNANSVTLLQSLQIGAAGFSGVMANFHPDLYVWLVENWNGDPHTAEQLQSFLGTAALIELQFYPVNAKYHLQQEGIIETIHSRVRIHSEFKPNQKMEVTQLESLNKMVKKSLVLEDRILT